MLRLAAGMVCALGVSTLFAPVLSAALVEVTPPGAGVSGVSIEARVILPAEMQRSLRWSPPGTRMTWSETMPDNLPPAIRRYAMEQIDPVFGTFRIGPADAAERTFILSRRSAESPYRERLAIDTRHDGRIDPARDVFEAEARDVRGKMWVSHNSIIVEIDYGPERMAEDDHVPPTIVRHEFSFWHVYPREDEEGEFDILRYSRRSWMEARAELMGEPYIISIIDGDNNGRITATDRWTLERAAPREDANDAAETYSTTAMTGARLDEPFFLDGQAYRLFFVAPSGTRAMLRMTDDAPPPIERAQTEPPRPQSEHALTWLNSFDEARAVAAREGRPLLVKWTAVWCGPCHQMDREAFRDEVVVDLLRERFVIVSIDYDKEYRLAQTLQVRGLPTLQIYSATGEEMERRVGLQTPARMEAWLKAFDQRAE